MINNDLCGVKIYKLCIGYMNRGHGMLADQL